MGRFRLFFRFDSASRIAVYAWVNDENTMRKAGALLAEAGSGETTSR